MGKSSLIKMAVITIVAGFLSNASASETCINPTSGYEQYFCKSYNTIFGARPAASTLNLFSSLYAEGRIGCEATIRDLVKEHPVRRQASSSALDVESNLNHINRMYWIVFGRGALPGDSPELIMHLRLFLGQSMDQTDQIFYSHPAARAHCDAYGLRM